MEAALGAVEGGELVIGGDLDGDGGGVFEGLSAGGRWAEAGVDEGEEGDGEIE